MDTILRTNDLTKKYGSKLAVNSINMTINKGDIYGFLGENGAGKTTTLKMLLGQIGATSGSIELFGETINEKDYLHKNRIGILLETPCFYSKLTVRENLEIHRRCMGVQNKSAVDEVMELVHIKELQNTKVRKLSLGMKQRLGIARAVLNSPEFLILDEPTNGLDAVGINELRTFILSLKKERKTTFLIASHILSEIQQLATKIGVLHQGVLIEEISYKELEEKNKSYLRIKVADDKKAVMVLEQECGITRYTVCGSGIINIFENLGAAPDINEKLVQSGVRVMALEVNKGSLEDYFLSLIGGNKGA